jgi:hypothetical protein
MIMSSYEPDNTSSPTVASYVCSVKHAFFSVWNELSAEVVGIAGLAHYVLAPTTKATRHTGTDYALET